MLAKVAILYTELFGVAGNGLLPNVKMGTALSFNIGQGVFETF